MHLSNAARMRITAFGIFFAPLLVVKLAAFFLGENGPSRAIASESPLQVQPPFSLAPTLSGTPSARQLHAAQRAADLHALPFSSSPLYYTPSERPAVVESPPPPPVGPNAPPSFRVHGIFVTSSVISTIIDGKVYKLGDRLPSTSWVISDIDNDKRTVTIFEPDSGRTVVRSVDAPARTN